MRQEEGVESISSKINKANNGIKVSKDKKRGKFGWQALIFHSVIQTRRTASITNNQINEQICESIGLDSEKIITKKCMTQLYLWMNQLESNKRKMVDKRQNEIIIQTDASISGWGASVTKNNIRIRRICAQWEAGMENSNLREILAIYKAVQVLKEFINQQGYN
ncbi:MAG: hypothetical protein EZS28_043573 [Streblomastix strix]|uniref:Uncharacterized protein n=1 Tax=Streblomastix strix TaxID=222440 RepID=A0A5J4TSP0_9EUKA|nr:MAG: hypothetical protein EZS28_043573 [Streblomastix strix]